MEFLRSLAAILVEHLFVTDRRTERHMATAYTMFASHRMVMIENQDQELINLNMIAFSVVAGNVCRMHKLSK